MDTVTLQVASGKPGVADMHLQVPLNDLVSGAPLVMAKDRQGRSVKLTLVPDDVSISEEIPTWAAGFKNAEWRADEISPVVLVDKDVGQYRNLSGDNVFVHVPVKGHVNGPVQLIDLSSSLAPYRCLYRFIGTPINPVTERQSTFRLRQAATNMIMTKMMLDREVDVVSLVTTLTNWNANQRVTLGAGFEWSVSGTPGVDSDPVKDLQDRIEGSDTAGSEFWMNPKTAFAFLRHPAVKDYMRQMYGDTPPTAISSAQGAPVARSGIRDFTLLGVGTIKIESARKRNTTTGKNDYLWPDGVVTYLTQTEGMPTDMESMATTKTLRTRGPAGTGFGTRQYRLEAVGPEGTDVIAIFNAEIPLMTANSAGGIITGALG